MVCTRVVIIIIYMVCARVAWLHGLRSANHVTMRHAIAPMCMSRGYMVCAMDSDHRKKLARLRQRRHTYHMSVPRSCENECCAIPRVAGSVSFNAVAFLVINPRHACAERVTVVVSCVCLSVCMYVCMSVRTRYSGSTRS